MSYCNNCRVELDDSAEKCALCGAQIADFNKEKAENTPYPFSDEVFLPERVKREKADAFADGKKVSLKQRLERIFHV